MSEPGRSWLLTGADGRPCRSPEPGAFGGHRRRKLYGRLDCPAALRAIARGTYVAHRVFFADERAAVLAGYRPCAVCLGDRYAEWKASPAAFRESVAGEAASATAGGRGVGCQE